MMLRLGCFGLIILSAGNAGAWQRIPVTQFPSAHAKIAVEAAIGEPIGVRLVIDDLPALTSDQGVIPLEVVDYQNSSVFIFGRKLFIDEPYFGVLEITTRQMQTVSAPDWLKEFLFKKAAPFRNSIYFVAYDVFENQNVAVKLSPDPSGSWQFQRLGYLKFGGRYAVESKIFSLPGITLDFCSENVCYRINAEDELEEYKLHPDCQIIEAIKVDNQIYALIRYENGLTERYSEDPLAGKHEIIDVASGTSLQSYDEAVYNLHSEQGKFKVDRMGSARQIADALRFELSRLDLSGAFRLGTSNFEGRVAWSQVYFLHGLMDIAEYARDLLNSDEISLIEKRIDIEITCLDELLNQRHDIQTKRYSIGRQAHRYAVQTGRILGVFARYLERHNRIRLNHVKRFAESVYSLKGHAEYLTRLKEWDSDYDRLKNVYYLRWPKGFDLQYDGINVPYNHQNDWMAGILQFYSSVNAKRININIFKDMTHTLIEKEQIGCRNSKNPVWNYTWGIAEKGWTASVGISKNTPSYLGDKNKAHISYRTIDASAIYEAHSHIPGFVPGPVLNTLKNLIQHGCLYPFLMRHIQTTDSSFRIDKRIADHYARTANSWELPNSVWALLSLARQLDNSHGLERLRPSEKFGR